MTRILIGRVGSNHPPPPPMMRDRRGTDRGTTKRGSWQQVPELFPGWHRMDHHLLAALEDQYNGLE